MSNGTKANLIKWGCMLFIAIGIVYAMSLTRPTELQAQTSCASVEQICNVGGINVWRITDRGRTLYLAEKPGSLSLCAP